MSDSNNQIMLRKLQLMRQRLVGDIRSQDPDVSTSLIPSPRASDQHEQDLAALVRRAQLRQQSPSDQPLRESISSHGEAGAEEPHEVREPHVPQSAATKSQQVLYLQKITELNQQITALKEQHRRELQRLHVQYINELQCKQNIHRQLEAENEELRQSLRKLQSQLDEKDDQLLKSQKSLNSSTLQLSQINSQLVDLQISQLDSEAREALEKKLQIQQKIIGQLIAEKKELMKTLDLCSADAAQNLQAPQAVAAAAPWQGTANPLKMVEPKVSEPRPSQDTNIISSINTDELKKKFVEKAKQQTLSEEPETSRLVLNLDENASEDHPKKKYHKKSASKNE